MAEKFSISFKVRAKHGIIHNYMLEHGLNAVELAKEIGISSATMFHILHFRWFPKDKDNAIPIIRKLESFFNLPINELFPPELVERISNNQEIKDLLQKTQYLNKEIDIEYLPFYKLPEIVYEPNLDNFELKEKIDQTLSGLTEREAKVLRARFGLDDEQQNCSTLEETAMELGVTIERVRQIEAKALRKIRHPARLKTLKDYQPEWIDWKKCAECGQENLLPFEVITEKTQSYCKKCYERRFG